MEMLRASAWTIPTVLSAAAIALAQFSLWVDHTLVGTKIPWYQWVSTNSIESARLQLSTIAASVLSVAGVSFSSIVVTMTLASQQFGPRLLRNFIKDKTSQAVLGSLIATFVYCLFILRGIRSAEESAFTPQLSVLLAFILVLICLGLFIHFVHHVISVIQAENVVHDSHQVFEETIDSMFPPVDDPPPEHRAEDNDLEGWQVVAGVTGYVQAISFERLINVAAKADAVLLLNCRAGHFVTERQPAITVVEGPAADQADADFIEAIQSALFTGPVRTPEQDFEYGIRQLVEVALRALSPGINDPMTAMNCIDYLSAGLQSAFARPLPATIHRDEEGNIRLFTWKHTYESLVSASFDQIRQAAREHCDVSCRILEALAHTANVADLPEQQRALLQQAELINMNTLPALFNDYDCEAVRKRFSQVTRSCHLIHPFQNV